LTTNSPPLFLIDTDTFGSVVHLAEGLIALTVALAAARPSPALGHD
jgi:hypothetical protein